VVLDRDRMLTVGDAVPPFAVKAAVSTEPSLELVVVTSDSLIGSWVVLFFWPLDFTAVCPTEILEFARHASAFEARNARVLGVSSDSAWAHVAWRQRDLDLRDVPFPMAGDPDGDLARAMGVYDDHAGLAMRATFIADPEGIIRWASVHDVRCGRSVVEVLRVLDALRTGRLTPCEWQPGEATLLV
jgi:peroxiredoxin (alkyl hydroperoxide reductase subunit C)